jgi:hypothetical protein
VIPTGEHSEAALIVHPRFDEAMKAGASAFVSFYRGNWLLNRVANDRGRVISAFIMLDLHFSRGSAGFTVSQLREEARRYALCSPNRITALAALLRVGGFLKAVPAQDSRMRKLAPTENMVALHRERLLGVLAANAMVNPDLTQAMPMLSTDEIMGDVVRAYLAHWRSGLRVTCGEPGLEEVIERDAGLTILFLLLTEANLGIGHRISDLARHFAISRTHALSIMRIGQEYGFITQTEAGGPYIGTPLLIATMRPVFVIIFQIQAEAVRFALRRQGERSKGQIAARA